MGEEIDTAVLEYYDCIEQGICPSCHNELTECNGCHICYDCGWSACDA